MGRVKGQKVYVHKTTISKHSRHMSTVRSSHLGGNTNDDEPSMTRMKTVGLQFTSTFRHVAAVGCRRVPVKQRRRVSASNTK